MTQTDGQIYFLDWKNQYCQITILPRAIYRFSVTPNKLTMAIFTELEQEVFINLFGDTKDLEKPKQS